MPKKKKRYPQGHKAPGDFRLKFKRLDNNSLRDL